MIDHMSEHTSGSTTSAKAVSNRRATLDREALFSALELFVNTGDSVRDLQVFRSQHRDFFRARFYDASEELANAGKDTYFHWYKRTVRTVWEGRDAGNTRLRILLGIRQVHDADPGPRELRARRRPLGDFEKEEQEYQDILDDDLFRQYGPEPNAHLVKIGADMICDVIPDWWSGALQYDCEVHFQLALYELMRESWRARVCPICRRYMIAEKPANFYCSVECAGAAKRKRDLEYWRAEGGKARTAKKKSRSHKRGGRS
jgi:hypothetical protein